VSRRTLLANAALAALLYGAAPRPALAQTPTNPRARAAFTEGVALLRRERFVEAMPLLEEATRLDPTPTAWFDLALAYRGAGRIAAAATAFERYLAAPEPGAPEVRLRAIRDELSTLLRSVARLRIDVTPATATVRVDGREAQLSQGELRVDPGTHVLEIDAPEHLPARREITPQAGMSMMLEVRLQPRVAAVTSPAPLPPHAPTPAAPPPPSTGTVTIEPSVPGASVSIDGEARGSGAVTVSLPPGAAPRSGERRRARPLDSNAPGRAGRLAARFRGARRAPRQRLGPPGRDRRWRGGRHRRDRRGARRDPGRGRPDAGELDHRAGTLKEDALSWMKQTIGMRSTLGT